MYSLFQNVEELFNSNQNLRASPNMHVELKCENHLKLACQENNPEFRSLVVANKRSNFFKFSLFQYVKESFNSNECWDSSIMYVILII